MADRTVAQDDILRYTPTILQKGQTSAAMLAADREPAADKGVQDHMPGMIVSQRGQRPCGVMRLLRMW